METIITFNGRMNGRYITTIGTSTDTSFLTNNKDTDKELVHHRDQYYKDRQQPRHYGPARKKHW